jgi:hypothetical protein
MSLLEIGSFSGTCVIFDHPAACYRYSPALEMYRVRDTRLSDIATCLNPLSFTTVFSENFEKALNSKEPVISMPYNPITAKVLEVCLHKYFGGFLDTWLCVSFFNDDKDTAKIALPNGDNPLEYKAEVIKGLLNYPYIKKIEVPYNYLLTYPSLYNLLETVI